MAPVYTARSRLTTPPRPPAPPWPVERTRTAGSRYEQGMRAGTGRGRRCLWPENAVPTQCCSVASHCSHLMMTKEVTSTSTCTSSPDKHKSSQVRSVCQPTVQNKLKTIKQNNHINKSTHARPSCMVSVVLTQKIA